MLRCLTAPWSVALLFVAISLHGSRAQADEPILIAAGDANGPKQPQAAIANDGTLYVVFGSGEEVSVSSSRDHGKSFSKPVVAFRVPNLSLGMRRGPRITCFGDALIVTAIGGKQGKGRDGDVLAWHSSDRGQSWKGPVQVNDQNDSAREGLHAMAVSSSGEAWCTWLDLRNQRTELFVAKSVDGGASWSPNQLVYSSPEKSICECCHPSMAVDGDTVHVLFRNSLAGNRDMYLTSLQPPLDKSKTRSMQLGKEHWRLNQCPMDGGMLAIDSDGLVSTVWRRNREIFFARNDGKAEQMLAPGEQPWVVSTKAGPIVVWSTRRDGSLMLQSISQDEATEVATSARDAVVVAQSKNATVVFVFWEQSEKGKSSIFSKAIDLESSKSR